MDVHSVAQRSGNMAAIKNKDTKPEMIVRRLAHGLGYRYALHSSRLPGKPDLVFSARRKVIFVHGCFWHMHKCPYGSVVPATRTDFWQAKRFGNVTRDRGTMSALKRLEWHVLVIWECETKKQALLTKRLTAFLEGPQAP